MQNKYNLDDKDKAILSLLQKHSLITNQDLAKNINLSNSACLERTKRLFNNGYIKQYTAIVDQFKVGLTVSTLTFVTLNPHNRKTADSFVAKIKAIPQIIECHNISGSWDYCLKIVSENIDNYRNFVLDTLLELPGVEKIDSQIILKTEKNTSIPIN